MKTVCLDFESFFCTKSGYTLRKMTTESYIRDKRFQAHGAAIKWSSDTAPRWYDDRQLRYVLAQENWSNTAVLCHHSSFDCLILSHHYGVRPRFIFDSLSCARLLLGNHLSVGLDSLARHFGLQAKTVPYNLFDGKHWDELIPAVQQQVADGCCHDVDLTWDIFKILAKDMPREEFEVIDATVRMFTEPRLRCDVEHLARVWEQEENNKSTRLQQLDLVDDSQLQSADKFAELLRQAGVEPETKPGKNGDIYCFAKNDPFMKSLLEDEDDYVRLLAEARVGAKSTLAQSRAEKWGWMASRGDLCVYLSYAGAHTSRFSGGDGTNFQNPLPVLNKAIVAPEGYWLAAPDASQIECRLLNFLAGQMDKIEEFRNGTDPYVAVAEAFCGHKITKETHPELRQAGKVVELQAGYQSGGEKIRNTLRVKAGISVSVEDGERYKKAYRDTHPKVVALWKEGARMISRLAGGPPTAWGPTEIRDGKIILPNGIPLHYNRLHYHKPGPDEIVDNPWELQGYWRHLTRDGWQKLYGGKIIENWIQALARVVVTQAMLRIIRSGFRVVGMKHDDLWILIPKDGQAIEALSYCKHEMSREPDWLPGIPLAAEGILGDRYAK